MKKMSLLGCICLLVWMLPDSSLLAQTRVFANTVVTSTQVDNASNAIDGNLATSASVRANSGLVAGIGSYTGVLTLQFPSTLPANTTSYVKVQTNSTLFNALLGGSLGNLLASTLSLVLGGEQIITVEALENTTVRLSGSTNSVSDFSGTALRVVEDKEGNFYFAITPTQAYNRIRISHSTGANLLGLGEVRSVNVFDAFYSTAPDPCGTPQYTNFDGSGVTLNILNAGGGVSNAERAIDGSNSTFSNINLGVLAVSASLSQNIFFESISNSTDQARIRLGLDASLVNLGLLNNIQIRALNDGSQVGAASANSLVSLDLLGLLQSGQVVDIFYNPGAAFDQIQVTVTSLLGVNIAQGIQLHEVARVPPPPSNTTNTAAQTICSGFSTTLLASTLSGTELVWFASATATTPLAVGSTYSTGVLTSTTTFFVGARVVGCTEISSRIPIIVTVNTLPTAPTIADSSPSFCINDGATLASISVTASGTLVWYANSTGGSPLPSNTILVNGSTYYAVNVDPITLCESSTRLAVTPEVTLNLCDTDGDGINDALDACVSVPGLAPNGCPAVLIRLKAGLQGAATEGNQPFTLLSENLMRDALRSQGLLPRREPYTGLGWTQVTVFDTLFNAPLAVTGPNALVDWVLVEIRSAVDPTSIVARQAVLIQRDGDLCNTNGDSVLAISIPAGNYHVGIRHRNHLGITTLNPITLNEISQLLDLQTVSLLGTQPAAVLNGKQYLWAGNANVNSTLIAQGANSDRSTVLQTVLNSLGNTQSSPNFILSSYAVSDVNLDGRTIFQGIGSDATYILNVVLGIPTNTSAESTFILSHSLP